MPQYTPERVNGGSVANVPNTLAQRGASGELNTGDITANDIAAQNLNVADISATDIEAGDIEASNLNLSQNLTCDQITADGINTPALSVEGISAVSIVTTALTDDISNQKVNLRKNGTSVGTRKSLNLIEGTKVAITAEDDAANNRVNLTLALAAMASQRILARSAAGSGAVEELTASQVLDFLASMQHGDILVRGSGAWTRLAAGTSGHILQTNGSGAVPSWVPPASGSEYGLTSMTQEALQGKLDALKTRSNGLNHRSMYTIPYGVGTITLTSSLLLPSTVLLDLNGCSLDYTGPTSAPAVLCQSVHSSGYIDGAGLINGKIIANGADGFAFDTSGTYPPGTTSTRHYLFRDLIFVDTKLGLNFVSNSNYSYAVRVQDIRFFAPRGALIRFSGRLAELDGIYIHNTAPGTGGTFTANATTNQITTDFSFAFVGDGGLVYFMNASGATLPAPLAAGVKYYLRAATQGAGPYNVYPTSADAIAGTNAIDLTTAGSGSLSIIGNFVEPNGENGTPKAMIDIVAAGNDDPSGYGSVVNIRKYWYELQGVPSCLLRCGRNSIVNLDDSHLEFYDPLMQSMGTRNMIEADGESILNVGEVDVPTGGLLLPSCEGKGSLGRINFHRRRASQDPQRSWIFVGNVNNREYDRIEMPQFPSGLKFDFLFDATLLHLRNNSFAPQLTDISGNGRHFTQALEAGQAKLFAPVNDYPFLRFDVDGYAVARFLSGATAVHLFYLIRAVADPSAGTNTACRDEFGTDETTLYPFTDGTIHDNSFTTVRKPVGNPAQNLTQWHVYSVLSAPTLFRAKINGVQIYTTPTNDVSDGPTTYQIGSRSGVGNFGGDIRAIGIIGREISESEEQAVIDRFMALRT